MTRMLVARILVVLASLLAAVALLAGFIRYQALDNETFSNSAAELIANKTVRDQIAVSLVEALYANVDVSAALEERLPPDQQGLAGPISAVARELADRAAVRVLERPRAQDLWVRSLSTTHEQLLRVLDDDLTCDQHRGRRGRSEPETARGPARRPRCDLRPRRRKTPGRRGPDRDHAGRSAPDGAGRDPVPEDPGAIPLDRAAAARRARDLARRRPTAVDRPRARDRSDHRGNTRPRRCAASPATTSSTTSSRPSPCRPAASAAYEILTDLLRDGGRTLVGLGLVLLLGVWLVGPGSRAVAVRRRLAPWLERPEIAYGAAALLLALLVWWGPTAQVRRWQLILAFAVMLGFGVAALTRAARADEALPAPAPEPEPPATV